MKFSPVKISKPLAPLPVQKGEVMFAMLNSERLAIMKCPACDGSGRETHLFHAIGWKRWRRFAMKSCPSCNGRGHFTAKVK